VSQTPSSSSLSIEIVRLDPDLPLPSYARAGDAGADVMTTVDVTLAPGERALVSTGIAVALPEGYVALVHPRSGLAVRHGLSIVNTPGTVDAGYRGEIKVLLINHDPAESVVLRRGDRIAQLVIQRVERAAFVEVDRLPDSERGGGGYGSTGGFGTDSPHQPA
jgi:dUTP pyrophosphatase